MRKLNRKVMCPRCGKNWRYAGKISAEKTGVICCPWCRTTMSLETARRRAIGHPVSERYQKDVEVEEVKKLWTLTKK